MADYQTPGEGDLKNTGFGDRGPRGGFVLARDPDRINLHEIYEAIDGEIVVHHRCVLGKKACSYKECVFGSLVDDIQQKVSTQFLASTLDKLIHR